MASNTKKYKQEISKILKCSLDQIFLYWKGRVALYAILKAMGVKENDEIITSGIHMCSSTKCNNLFESQTNLYRHFI